MGIEDFETGLERRSANFASLTPLTFLAWSADVYPDRRRRPRCAPASPGAGPERCRRLASALRRAGIGRGDTVAVMLANTPEMYECHFGVPMTGAVLNALNTRLDADAIRFMLQHGEAKVLIADREFSPTIGAALRRWRGRRS